MAVTVLGYGEPAPTPPGPQVTAGRAWPQERVEGKEKAALSRGGAGDRVLIGGEAAESPHLSQPPAG